MKITYDSLEDAAADLDTSPDYRVLRRLVPPKTYHPFEGDPSVLHRGLIIDTETTGFEADTDKIIELALLPFRFDANGVIYSVEDPIVMREDPGVPLPAEIVELTGLTDADLKGQHFDEGVVALQAANSVLNIAHVAKHDRPFMEQRFPKEFVGTVWGCSWAEVPWKKFGIRSSTLDYLLMAVGRAFNDAHRAESDCHSLLHILNGQDPLDGHTFLSYVLDSVRTPTLRIQVNPPYGMNQKMKDAGYQATYERGKFKHWAKEVRTAGDLAVEEDFLVRVCQISPPITGKKVTARERYSRRV